MGTMQQRVLLLIIAISLVAAAWCLWPRVQSEMQNRTVAIAVEYHRVQQLAGLCGKTPAQVLAMLKSAGATHVIIREDSLRDLLDAKQLTVIEQSSGIGVSPAPGIRSRVFTTLSRVLPGATVTDDGVLWYQDAAAIAALDPVGVGYSEQAVADAQTAGLSIVARPVGEMTIRKESIDASLDAVQWIGADIVIFAGIEVFGVHDLVKYAGEQMDERGIQFGYIEMAAQFGEAKLAGAVQSRIIRCHALAVGEMVKVLPSKAIDRFALAVRERNVRLCYIRPYLQGADDPVQAAMDFTAGVCGAIAKSGHRPGTPQPFTPLSVAPGVLMVLLIGIGAAAIWLLQTLFSLSPKAFAALLVADVVLSAGCAFVATGLAQHVGALGAAIVFPSLGLLIMRPREGSERPDVWQGMGLFFIVAGISLCGGLLAAACLSDLPHMMQLATFRGVKLAQVTPLLLVLIVFAARCAPAYVSAREKQAPGAPEWPALREGALEALSAVVKYWHVALIFAGMAVLAILVMRSGNATPMPPSGLELKVRAVLEDLLVVRPRSKEIFFGHPILIITLAFLAAGRRRWLWVGMLLGAIGQVSLVNTFGHIHTPLVISLIRVFYGLCLGGVGGIVAWAIGWAALGMYRRLSYAPGPDAVDPPASDD